MGFALAVLMSLWVVLITDVNWILAVHGPDILFRLQVFLMWGLLLILVLGVPNNPEWRKRWQWYTPFLLYVFPAVVTLSSVANPELAREGVQTLMLWWAVIVGTTALLDNVRRVETLLVMYALQFIWWGMWGAKSGAVYWHNSLSNYDGFGSINVGGMAFCYFLAMASPTPRFRWLMYLTTGICALGVVASFARGAVLAAAILFLIIWLRSPNKGKTFVAGVGAAVLVMIATSVLFDEGFFWAEIMSTFEEGVDEGTGAHRWTIWGAAWRVFLEHPVFGAGQHHWGVVASSIIDLNELGEGFAVNPAALNRLSLHNLYMTTLSELGTIGSIALLWILVDYFRRNRALRTEAAQRHWQAMGGRFKLKHVSLGLESMMIAFLVNAAFYSMMVIHWFYTMLALNLVLHALVVRGAAREQKAASLPAHRRPLRPAFGAASGLRP